MTSVVPTTTTVGIIKGKITRRKIVISPAPSTRAASKRSAGMPFKAADRITMAKPVIPQVAAAMIAKLSTLGARHPIRRVLGEDTKDAFHVPVLGAARRRVPYNKFPVQPKAN